MENQQYNESNLKIKIYTAILVVMFAVLFMSTATVFITGAEGLDKNASPSSLSKSTNISSNSDIVEKEEDKKADSNNTSSSASQNKDNNISVSDSNLNIDDKNKSKFVQSAAVSNDITIKNADGKVVNPDSVQIVTSNLGDNEKKDVLAALNKIAPNVKNHVMYDIELLDDNGEQLSITSGGIVIKLNYPSDLKNPEQYNFKVYHYNSSNGKLEPLDNVKVDASGVTFVAKSFSPYVLTWSLKKSAGDVNSPATGENMTATVAAGYIAVISLFIIAIVLIKLKIAKGRQDYCA